MDEYTASRMKRVFVVGYLKATRNLSLLVAFSREKDCETISPFYSILSLSLSLCLFQLHHTTFLNMNVRQATVRVDANFIKPRGTKH